MRTEPETRAMLTRTQILRARDVAALLHVPTSTIHEWARTGKLPSRKRGRHRLFILDEIQEWIHAED